MRSKIFVPTIALALTTSFFYSPKASAIPIDLGKIGGIFGLPVPDPEPTTGDPDPEPTVDPILPPTHHSHQHPEDCHYRHGDRYYDHCRREHHRRNYSDR